VSRRRRFPERSAPSGVARKRCPGRVRVLGRRQSRLRNRRCDGHRAKTCERGGTVRSGAPEWVARRSIRESMMPPTQIQETPALTEVVQHTRRIQKVLDTCVELRLCGRLILSAIIDGESGEARTVREKQLRCSQTRVVEALHGRLIDPHRSWAGCCPRLDETAGERRSTRVRKGTQVAQDQDAGGAVLASRGRVSRRRPRSPSRCPFAVHHMPRDPGRVSRPWPPTTSCAVTAWQSAWPSASGILAGGCKLRRGPEPPIRGGRSHPWAEGVRLMFGRQRLELHFPGESVARPGTAYPQGEGSGERTRGIIFIGPHRNCHREACAFARREERWRRACQRSVVSSMVSWLFEN